MASGLIDPLYPELFLFVLAWAGWCLLHSLLISGPLARLSRSVFGRAHRIIYNLFAVMSLIPLLFWGQALKTPEVFTWPLFLWPVRVVLIACALWLIWAGSRVFSLSDFSGFGYFSNEHDYSESSRLVTDGILARVRHPWYAAGLILLWMRDLDIASLSTSLILSAYLLIGAFIEEQRLFKQHGQAYLDYKKHVPMFVPRNSGKC